MTNQISSYRIDGGTLSFGKIGVDEDAAAKEIVSVVGDIYKRIVTSADLVKQKDNDALLQQLSKRVQLYFHTFVPSPTPSPTPEQKKSFELYDKLDNSVQSLVVLNNAKISFNKILAMVGDVKEKISSDNKVDVSKQIAEIESKRTIFKKYADASSSPQCKDTLNFWNSEIGNELQKVKNLQNPKAEITSPVQTHESNNNNNAIVQSKTISDNNNNDAKETIKACFDKLNTMVSTPNPDWSAFAKALKSEGQKLWNKGFSNLEHLLHGITYFQCEKKKHSELHVGGEKLISEGKISYKDASNWLRSAAGIIQLQAMKDLLEKGDDITALINELNQIDKKQYDILGGHIKNGKTRLDAVNAALEGAKKFFNNPLFRPERVVEVVVPKKIEDFLDAFNSLNTLLFQPTVSWNGFSNALDIAGEKLQKEGFGNIAHWMHGIVYSHCDKAAPHIRAKYTGWEKPNAGQNFILSGQLPNTVASNLLRSAAGIIQLQHMKKIVEKGCSEKEFEKMVSNLNAIDRNLPPILSKYAQTNTRLDAIAATIVEAKKHFNLP